MNYWGVEDFLRYYFLFLNSTKFLSVVLLMNENYPRYIYYIRWAVGLFLLLLGALFMFIPFIPLGYAFIVSGILILGPQLPFYRRMINWLVKKDKSGKISRIEKKIDRWENQVEMKIEKWLKKD